MAITISFGTKKASFDSVSTTESQTLWPARTATYPILEMVECLDSLGEAWIFSTLNANYLYLPIKCNDWDKDMVTFTSSHGLYRYLTMICGLENTQSTFQRAMNPMLPAVKWKLALVNLDDDFIFARSVEELMDQVQTVLGQGWGSGVSLELKKWSFLEEIIDHLGPLIQPDRLDISANATNLICRLPHPTNLNELKSFLALCIVSRRLVQNFT